MLAASFLGIVNPSQARENVLRDPLRWPSVQQGDRPECPIPVDLKGPVKRAITPGFPNVLASKSKIRDYSWDGVTRMKNLGWKVGKGRNAYFIPAGNKACPFAMLAYSPRSLGIMPLSVFHHRFGGSQKGPSSGDVRRFHKRIHDYARSSEHKSVRKAGRSLPLHASPKGDYDLLTGVYPSIIFMSSVASVPVVLTRDWAKGMNPTMKVATGTAIVTAGLTAGILMIRGTKPKWDRYNKRLAMYYLRVRAAHYQDLKIDNPE
jgi:hypothetical protein